MQLTSGSMQCEFRPHNILTDKFVYTLKLKGDAMSVRLMNKKEMKETINARIDLGYQVTDFLTEPQSYFPACCWFYYKMIMTPDLDLLLSYENGTITEDDFFFLFQQIYDTKAYNWLQGHYGRTVKLLLDEGLIYQ